MNDFNLRKYLANNPLLKEDFPFDSEAEDKAIEIFVTDFGKTRNDYFNLNDDEKEVLLNSAAMELSMMENDSLLTFIAKNAGEVANAIGTDSIIDISMDDKDDVGATDERFWLKKIFKKQPFTY